MKQISGAVAGFGYKEILSLEQEGTLAFETGGQEILLTRGDVEIVTEDIPGWIVATEGQMTIALDVEVTEPLRQEGLAREFINKIQNLRKESGFEVTDRIKIKIEEHNEINDAVYNHKSYICAQTLAVDLQLIEKSDILNAKEVEISKDVSVKIFIERYS